MLSSHIFIALLGLFSGLVVSAGTFAFIIVIGVIPRMVGKSNTARHALYYENAICLGGILGNIASVYLNLRIPLGSLFLALYGLCAGIFVGCLAVALSEILNTFPIMFRRLKIKVGLGYIIFFMAIGKTCGAFYFFYHGMHAP